MKRNNREINIDFIFKIALLKQCSIIFFICIIVLLLGYSILIRKYTILHQLRIKNTANLTSCCHCKIKASQSGKQKKLITNDKGLLITQLMKITRGALFDLSSKFFESSVAQKDKILFIKIYATGDYRHIVDYLTQINRFSNQCLMQDLVICTNDNNSKLKINLLMSCYFKSDFK